MSLSQIERGKRGEQQNALFRWRPNVAQGDAAKSKKLAHRKKLNLNGSASAIGNCDVAEQPVSRTFSSGLENALSLGRSLGFSDALAQLYDVKADKELGRGLEGVVHLAYRKSKISNHENDAPREKVAVKEMAKWRVCGNERQRHQLLREVQVMQLLRGAPFICQLVDDEQGVFEDRWNVYFVFELYARGDFLSELKRMASYDESLSPPSSVVAASSSSSSSPIDETKKRTESPSIDETKKTTKSRASHERLTEADAIGFVGDMLRAVYECHRRRIVHGDIKAANFLVSADGRLHLADFGFARHFDDDAEKCVVHERVGTLFYMSPEQVDGHWSFASDMWSVGVILYMLLAGARPFDGVSKSEVWANIKAARYNVELTRSLSANAQALIARLLDPNAETRIDAKSALEHSWLSSGGKDELPCTLQRLCSLTTIDDELAAAAEQLAAQLSAEQIDQIRQLFDTADADGSGALSFQEFLQAASASPDSSLRVEQIRALFNKLDLDGDGLVDWTEFLRHLIIAQMALRNEVIQGIIDDTASCSSSSSQ
jgi:serine/threonine protein kinase